MIDRLSLAPLVLKSGLKLQYHNNNYRLVLGTVPFKFWRWVNSIRRDEVLSSVTSRDHPVHISRHSPGTDPSGQPRVIKLC